MWTGYRDRDGYGNIAINRSPRQAHRVAYSEYIGPIGDSQVLHKCDNPGCINPDHLYLGTHKDNMRDKRIRNRVKGENHPKAKLTDEVILAIRENPKSQGQIARDLGLNQSFIGKVKNRVVWTHI